jgi:hypothetical protein
MRLSKDSRIQVVREIGPKNYLIIQDMEECGHVLKQFIQSGLMNCEESKTECPHKKLIQFSNKFMNIKISSFG